MALRINIWDDREDVEVGVTIHPYENNKYEYGYIIDTDDGYYKGEGELFSINPIYPLELPQMILTSILENYRKDKNGGNLRT